MVAEVVGGLLSGSLALLADAGHMLTDAAALLVALMAVHFSQRKPNARHTFGYLRLTTTAAFLNAAALLVIVVFILWEAIRRFFAPQPVMGTPMLIIAVAGLLANLFAFWLLHRGSEEKNINVRAAALHVLGDLLGSVGAIVAAIVILATGWTPIDPILSVLVSCLVLRSAAAAEGEFPRAVGRHAAGGRYRQAAKRPVPEYPGSAQHPSRACLADRRTEADDAACAGDPAA